MWLNARGNNTAFVWDIYGEDIKKENPLWWDKTPLELRSGPEDWGSRQWCLMFLVYGSNRDTEPGKPYQIFPCDGTAWTLCEGNPTIDIPQLTAH